MGSFDDPAFFGDRWAQVYQDLTIGPDPAAAVEFLAGLAGRYGDWDRRPFDSLSAKHISVYQRD